MKGCCLSVVVCNDRRTFSVILFYEYRSSWRASTSFGSRKSPDFGFLFIRLSSVLFLLYFFFYEILFLFPIVFFNSICFVTIQYLNCVMLTYVQCGLHGFVLPTRDDTALCVSFSNVSHCSVAPASSN